MYTKDYNHDETAFSSFLLMEAGLFLLVMSWIGRWAATSRSTMLMSIHLIQLIPIAMTLLGLGANNYKKMGDIKGLVAQRYATKPLPTGVTMDQVVGDKVPMYDSIR